MYSAVGAYRILTIRFHDSIQNQNRLALKWQIKWINPQALQVCIHKGRKGEHTQAKYSDFKANIKDRLPSGVCLTTPI